jgi:predicted nucleotidyltransferase
MAEGTAKSPLQQIVELFERHGVEFMVIGGQAEALFGSPRITYDVDLCYRRDAENLQRLAAALQELTVTLRGAPPDLPFRIDARALALGSNFTFNTPLGPLDLLAWVEPHGNYESLVKRAERYPLGQTYVRTISLDDLIRVKEHIRRPKDRESLLQLKAIKQVRAEPQPPPPPTLPNP